MFSLLRYLYLLSHLFHLVEDHIFVEDKTINEKMIENSQYLYVRLKLN